MMVSMTWQKMVALIPNIFSISAMVSMTWQEMVAYSKYFLHLYDLLLTSEKDDGFQKNNVFVSIITYFR